MSETALAIFPDEQGQGAPLRPPPASRQRQASARIRQLREAPLRRPRVVAFTLIGVVVLAVLGAFLLPKRYRSATLILVEWGKVPASVLPRGTAQEEPSRRLLTLQPEILSRTRLERVITETMPYPDVRSSTEAVEAMRNAITVQLRGNDVFTIEFVHADARKAQEVTQRLATLFIEETANAREQQMEETVAFLTQQVEEARAEVEEKEAGLRRFKEQRMGGLPEQLPANLATLQMLQQELRAVEDNLWTRRQQRDQLARATSGAEPVAAGAAPEPNVELVQLRNQLASLRGRYTEEHPDVQALLARIAKLETQRSQATARGNLAQVDPATATTQLQLARAENEIKGLEDRRAGLERRVASFSSRVEVAPRNEQELSTLMRDYQKLNENYLSLLNRKLEAEMAARLERRWKGERFRILDPAHLPDRPYFPSVPLLLTLGVILGLVFGLAAAVAVEYFDPTVKSAEELQELLPCPVLAQVPRLQQSSVTK